jgi:exonuclease III
MPVFQKSELAINCWNIYGLFNNRDGHRYNKLDLPELVEHVSQFKLFGLVESHHTADDISQLAIVNFKCFQVCRKKLSKGRKSGGICVYVHESISRGVKKIPTSGSESIMIKLDKDFFSLDRDIVVCFVYCVPTGSSYQVRTQFDPFEDLEQKLSTIRDDCDIITIGDLNARPGTKADYIPAEDNTSVPVFGRLCGTDTQAARPRGNLDCNTNSYGDKLIDLCKSVPLRICNGRKLGDIIGSYTCYKKHGQSTVDYCLVSPSIYNTISTFVISELFPDISDHCSVTVKVQTKYLSQFCNQQNSDLLEKPKRVKWDSSVSVTFEKISNL